MRHFEKEFAPMNYKIHWFFDFSGFVNYSLISKLVDQTYMLLILQLTTHVANR